MVFAEIKRADEWGLDAGDFALPPADVLPASPEAEIEISQAVLKYGRYARGGRIVNPSEQLSSYLDRRPQLSARKRFSTASRRPANPMPTFAGSHPAHPQFEKLRQKYLALLGRGKTEQRRGEAAARQHGGMAVDARRYGRASTSGITCPISRSGWSRTARSCAKCGSWRARPVSRRQSSPGSLKKITFRPTWIVPDSIKVRELWPSLLEAAA